jgi:hypothetical protein
VQQAIAALRQKLSSQTDLQRQEQGVQNGLPSLLRGCRSLCPVAFVSASRVIAGSPVVETDRVVVCVLLGVDTGLQVINPLTGLSRSVLCEQSHSA